MITVIDCPNCSKPMAKKTSKPKRRWVKPLGDTELTFNDDVAPKLKCGCCGKILWLIKGSAS